MATRGLGFRVFCAASAFLVAFFFRGAGFSSFAGAFGTSTTAAALSKRRKGILSYENIGVILGDNGRKMEITI